MVGEKEKTFLVLLSVDALKQKKNLANEDIVEFFKIRLSWKVTDLVNVDKVLRNTKICPKF